MGNGNSIRARRREFGKFKASLIEFEKLPGVKKWAIRQADNITKIENELILEKMIAAGHKAGLETPERTY